MSPIPSTDNPPTFIVNAIIRILEALWPVTFYHWIATVAAQRRDAQGRADLTHWSVEVYVLCWLVGAALAYCVASFDVLFVSLPLAAVGLLRVLEIVRFQALIILWVGPAARPLRGYRRSMVLLLCNYIELVLWFSVCYAALYSWNSFGIDHEINPRMLVILRESVGLLVANSSGSFDKPSGVLIWTVLTLNSVIGLFMTIVVAGRVISLLPVLSTLDKEEEK